MSFNAEIRASKIRRSLPLCLHTCVEHDSTKPDLRDVESGPRFPCPAACGSARQEIPLVANDARCCRILSSGRTSMDPEEWWLETNLPAWVSAFSNIPPLLNAGVCLGRSSDAAEMRVYRSEAG